MTQMTELVGQNIKISITNIFHVLKREVGMSIIELKDEIGFLMGKKQNIQEWNRFKYRSRKH